MPRHELKKPSAIFQREAGPARRRKEECQHASEKEKRTGVGRETPYDAGISHHKNGEREGDRR